jgi:hypothetical protein
MMKKMICLNGKKGDAGLSFQQLLFALAEMLIGAFLILLLLQLVLSGSKNAEATIIATDISTTMRTASSYPYPIYLSHTSDLSKGAINIKQDSIRVDISKGTYTMPLRVIRGITIQEKNFFNPLSIPIISMRDKIFFSDEGVQIMICEKLYKFPAGKKFTILYEDQNIEEKQKLNQLQDGINLLYSVDEKKNQIKIINHEDEDSQKIKISFNQDNNRTTIIHNKLEHEHETFVCYMKNAFSNENYKEISQVQIINQPETKILEIQLPSNNYLNNYLTNQEFEEHRKKTNVRSQTDLMQNYAIMIYYALLEIVEKE